MRRYTLSENLISALLGGVIAIPLCVGVYKHHSDVKIQEPMLIKGEPVTVEMAPITIEEDIPEIVEEPTINVKDLGEFKVTAYCPCSKCCGEWADGLTYTETIATEGRTIAVDPDVIPLGSIVEINGNEYIAEDIGGAIKDNRIDLFFASHDDALEWGVQYHNIFLIEFTQFRN